MDEIIRAENIKKKFKVKGKGKKYTIEVLDSISFNVECSQILGIVGKNGSGKSTILKIVSGVMKPDEGKVLVSGLDPFLKKKVHKKSISFIMGQKGQLDEDLSIYDNVLFIGSLYGLDKVTICQRISSFSRNIDIQNYLYQQVRTLSLGQRMKGELLLALIHLPNILLLDEPTLGLDTITQKQLRTFIKAYINESKERCAIIVSHNYGDIETLCDKILMIDHGKTIFYGDFNNLIENYDKRFLCIKAENANEIFTQDECIRYGIFTNGKKNILIPIKSGNEKAIMKILYQTENVEIDFVHQEIESIVEQILKDNKYANS